MKNAIVVLGNGYDLAHGSKTTYNDFVNQCEEEDNIWISHFRNQLELDRWVDVENEILAILEDMTALKETFDYESSRLIFDIKFMKIFRLFGFGVKRKRSETSITFNYIQIIGAQDISVMDMMEKMKSDFKKLKELLKIYIRKEIESNTNYGNNIELGQVLGKYDNVIVLNFNYTDTLFKYNQNTHNIFIHGDVDSEIILGHNNIENIEFTMFHKKIQQLSSKYNYKHDFTNVLMKVEEPTRARDGFEFTSKTYFDFIILGHSVDKNDHGILSWVYNTVLSSDYRIVDKLKVFNYKNEYNQDKNSRIYSIDNFFLNNFDLDLPMGKNGGRGRNEYKRLEEQNYIEHIKLTTLERNNDSEKK